MDDSRIFRYAKHIAEMSHFWRARLGCVVVYKKQIISVGFNSKKTHPLQKEYNKLRFLSDSTPHSIHAEIHALLPLRYLDINWNKIHLYIYRIKKDSHNHNLKGNARPCESCMAYIKNLGIRNIHYTTSSGFAHEILDIN